MSTYATAWSTTLPSTSRRFPFAAAAASTDAIRAASNAMIGADGKFRGALLLLLSS